MAAESGNARTGGPVRTSIDLAALILITLVTLGFLGLMTWANLDLSAGRHVLFMDELITFDNSEAILAARSIPDFFQAVVGWDQRYGRSLFYLSALFALPAYLSGSEQAVIVSLRMFQALSLVAAYAVLSFGLIRSNIVRLVAIVSLLALPTTAYYATMPKPEPIQLLFLALFLWLFFTKGKWVGRSWILLGLSFGAKVSIVFTIPIFLSLAWVKVGPKTWPEQRHLLARTLLPLLLGLVVSVPVLATHWQGLEFYIGQTFGQTAHGSDSPSITALSWLNLIFGGWLSANFATSAIVFAAIAGLAAAATAIAAWSGWQARDRRSIPQILLAVAEHPLAAGAVVFGMGLLLTLQIMVGIHRLWDFYLHNGMALMFVGALMCADRLLDKGRLATATVAIASLGMAANLAYTLPNAVASYANLSQRTATAEYQRKKAEFDAIRQYSREDAAKAGRQLTIAYDPKLFLPRDSIDHSFVRFFGQFAGWNVSYDAIIAYCEDLIVGDAVRKVAGCGLGSEASSHILMSPDDLCVEPCFAPREPSPRGLVYLVRTEPTSAQP